MTKYFQDKNRFEKNDDTPISVRNYEQMDSHKEFFCPYCQLKLSRLTDRSGLSPSWYCTKCTIEYPDQSGVKSKSSLSTPRKSNNDNPLASTKFKEPTVGNEPVEPKGAFKALQQRGIKITSYTEGKG